MSTTVKTPTKSASKNAEIPAKKGAAKDLAALFEDGLKDIYWAEKALLKALPKMHKNATAPQLKAAIEDHLAQTKEQVAMIEKAFEAIGKKAVAKKCDAMEGLIKEGEGVLEETQLGSVRDAAIIMAAQKVEHYEIASYGTLAAFAKVLGYQTALDYMITILDQEKTADELLSSIADTNLNAQAI